MVGLILHLDGKQYSTCFHFLYRGVTRVVYRGFPYAIMSIFSSIFLLPELSHMRALNRGKSGNIL